MNGMIPSRIGRAPGPADSRAIVTSLWQVGHDIGFSLLGPFNTNLLPSGRTTISRIDVRIFGRVTPRAGSAPSATRVRPPLPPCLHVFNPAPLKGMSYRLQSTGSLMNEHHGTFVAELPSGVRTAGQQPRCRKDQ